MIKTKKNEQNGNLEDAIYEIKKKFGEGAIMRLGEAAKMNVETIPTGSISLDFALGGTGVPKGRVVEIFGPEMSGKTTLALHIIAEAQRKGGKAAFIDAEHALDPEYAKRLGVNVDELLISQPDTGEDALNILESLVRSGAVSVIVVDSVAALTPRAEIEGEMGAQHIGLQARLMSQALRKLTALTDKTKTIIIFINQIRMKIGVMWGCLNYKSKVVLSNGTTEWIGRIVNQRKKLYIMSYDWKKHEIIPKQISNWYKNGKANKFLQITAYNPSGNGRSQLSCTPNHSILTPIGWRKAENLKIGDRVLISSIQRLSDFQMQIIRGSLLGDGCISAPRSRQALGVRFRLGHGLKQKRYLLWKAGLFKNIPHSISEEKKAIRFNMAPLPELYEMRHSIYKKDYKFFSADFLSQLTPLSLAIWYQDDGSLQIRNKKKDKGRINICIQAMHPDSRISLQKLLKERYDIETKLKLIAGKALMKFDQVNSEKFLLLLQRYIHPSMEYKLLPQNKAKFYIEPQFSAPRFKPISVPIINIADKPSTRSMKRFDIGVRGSHNFLADNIIVHNSPETTPGGNALKFYSSVRIDMRRIAQIKKGEEVVGNRVKAKIVKNKVAPPFKIAEFDLMFNEGISFEADLLNTGLIYGVITKAGNTLVFEKEKLGVGMEAAKKFLKENPKMAGEIKKAIGEKYKEKNNI